MKFRYKTDYIYYIMETVFVIFLIIGIYYQIKFFGNLWQKATGVIFLLSLFYYQLAYILLTVEFDEKKLVIIRPIHWNNKIETLLSDINEIIVNDMGSMFYLRILLNDRTEKKIDCTSISRHDLNNMVKKFNEIGISACSHFG